MIRIKICGLTSKEDIHLCASAGVDALGFVVEYPIPVPWNLERKTALQLMASVPPFVTSVIVVGDDPDEVLAITDMLRPNVVQLHGREPLDTTERLITKLKSLGVQVIKALRFSVRRGELNYDISDPVAACRSLADAGVDGVVLDSMTDSRPAGTGKSFDWKIARLIRDEVNTPVILAGGLNAENVRRAISEVRPYGVDVITGVESPIGKKDPSKVKEFIKEARWGYYESLNQWSHSPE
nr:phosphoribosylanthranilate isomerase [Desulfobacterales bacterium]